MYIHEYICTYKFMYTCIYIHVYIHICINMYIYTYVFDFETRAGKGHRGVPTVTVLTLQISRTNAWVVNAPQSCVEYRSTSPIREPPTPP